MQEKLYREAISLVETFPSLPSRFFLSVPRPSFHLPSTLAVSGS